MSEVWHWGLNCKFTPQSPFWVKRSKLMVLNFLKSRPPHPQCLRRFFWTLVPCWCWICLEATPPPYVTACGTILVPVSILILQEWALSDSGYCLLSRDGVKSPAASSAGSVFDCFSLFLLQTDIWPTGPEEFINTLTWHCIIIFDQ